jgi:2'-5' RNA ligase
MDSREKIYGVVLPVPEALARRANRARRLYDPNFRFIGPHVTVLPPRRLALSRQAVVEAVRSVAAKTIPFRIRLGAVRTFRPVMPVVFVGFRRGAGELNRLHRRLARTRLAGAEIFPYVPHLTLGQRLEDGRLEKAVSFSRQLFPSGHALPSWPAEFLLVVERRTERRWVTLDPVALPAVSARQSRARRG